MYHTTLEKHYRHIPAQIICEEYIDVFANCSRDDTPELLRVRCFNDKPHYIEADFIDSTGREYINIYNNRWQRQDVTVRTMQRRVREW